MFNGCRVLVYKMKRVLETDGGDGCTTLSIYLISLNCTLIMVNMVNFMLYVFYHNLKIGEKFTIFSHKCTSFGDLNECLMVLLLTL